MCERLLTPIAGFPGYYITPDGRLYSRRARRRGKLCDRLREVVCNVSRSSGYRRAALCPPGEGKPATLFVHRLVLSTFGPPALPGQVADHINGDRGDNRLANLRWASPKENVHSAWPRFGGKSWLTRGRARNSKLGEEAYSALVKEAAAIPRRPLGELKALAKRYGVSGTTVYRIRVELKAQGRL